MTDDSYPRDLVGYGRNPPDPRWPGGARIAVQFVLNYEEGGENCILHGDAASEAFLSEIVGAQPLPGVRHMNMESIYEYGSRAGFWRLLAPVHRARHAGHGLRRGHGAGAQPARPSAAMLEAGWEIASHGLRWIDYQYMASTPRSAGTCSEAIRIHAEVTGERPLGWYTGRGSPNTLRAGGRGGRLPLLRRHLRRRSALLGRRSTAGAQLIVPYTLDANDMRFATSQGFNSGDQFFTYLKDSFDVLYAEGDAARRR